MAYDMLLTAPAPTLVIGGETGLLITAPDPTIAITSYDHVMASADLTAPSPSIYMMGGGAMNVVVPEPLIDIEGGDNWYELNIEAPIPIVAMESTYTVGVMDIRAPPPEISILTTNINRTNIAINVPVPVIIITSHTVATGEMALTTPVLVINISTGGVVTEELPTTLLSAKTVVVNVDNWEISEYTWSFDQLVKFGNQYLAVNSSGIYKLGGDTNNGGIINSTIETGLDDFGASAPKRISNMYVGWKSTEDATLTLVMNEDEYEYDLISTDNKPESTRVNIGSPPLSRYVGIKIENENGADFDLYDMEMVLSTWKR